MRLKLTKLCVCVCVLVCLRFSSFDSIGFASVMSRSSVGDTAPETGTQAGADVTSTGARRNSFLYRSTDSITDISPMSMSRKVSAASGEVSVFVSITCAVQARV